MCGRGDLTTCVRGGAESGALSANRVAPHAHCVSFLDWTFEALRTHTTSTRQFHCVRVCTHEEQREAAADRRSTHHHRHHPLDLSSHPHRSHSPIIHRLGRGVAARDVRSSWASAASTAAAATSVTAHAGRCCRRYVNFGGDPFAQTSTVDRSPPSPPSTSRDGQQSSSSRTAWKQTKWQPTPQRSAAAPTPKDQRVDELLRARIPPARREPAEAKVPAAVQPPQPSQSDDLWEIIKNDSTPGPSAPNRAVDAAQIPRPASAQPRASTSTATLEKDATVADERESAALDTSDVVGMYAMEDAFEGDTASMSSQGTTTREPYMDYIGDRYPPGEPLFGRGIKRRPPTKTILAGSLSKEESAQRKANLESIAMQYGEEAMQAEKKKIRKADSKRRRDRQAYLKVIEPYIERNLRLVELEAEEDRKLAKAQELWSDDRRKREGVLLQGLEGYWLPANAAAMAGSADPDAEKKSASKRKLSWAASNYRIAVFNRPGKGKIGWTRLQKGDQVELRPDTPAVDTARADEETDVPEAEAEESTEADGEPGVFLATIKSISPYEVRLTFQDPPLDLDLLAHSTWRINQTYNDRLEARMRESVEALRHDVAATQRAGVTASGTYLVDVLLQPNRARLAPSVEQAPIMQWIKIHRPDIGPPDLGNLTLSQRRAVELMLNDRMSLIQGPPGTGKTHTIVAAIKVLKQHYNIPHPILLTSHTNVAVDNMAQGCLEAGLNVVRAGASVRVRDSLMSVTLEGRMEEHPRKGNLDDAEGLRVELIQKLQQASANNMSSSDYADTKLRLAKTIGRARALRMRIETDILTEADVVCCTALSVPTISAIDFPLVFFDEATMATEPITLATMVKGCQQMSLIGDHKQLSPLIRSREAHTEGLGQSMFERLMTRGDLQSVMLDTQHRMHPALSAFSAKEFYGGRLKDGKNTFEMKPLSSSFVPAKTDMAVTAKDDTPAAASAAAAHQHGFLTFVHHTKEERVASSKSLENVAEAQLVVSITADLLVRNPDLTGRDIAILTPYNGQRQLLSRSLQDNRTQLRQRFARELERLGGAKAKARISELADIEVETIDGFEGREKRAIVFSMVRNNTQAFWGFLLEHKRWNVALTRARSGMWILGSMDMLEDVGRKSVSMATAAAEAAAAAEKMASKKEKAAAAASLLPKDADEIDGVAEVLARKPAVVPISTANSDAEEHVGFIARFAKHLRSHNCIVDAASLFPKMAAAGAAAAKGSGGTASKTKTEIKA